MHKIRLKVRRPGLDYDRAGVPGELVEEEFEVPDSWDHQERDRLNRAVTSESLRARVVALLNGKRADPPEIPPK